MHTDNETHAVNQMLNSLWFHLLITILEFASSYYILSTLVRTCSTSYGAIFRDPLVYAELIEATNTRGCAVTAVLLSLLLWGIISLAISINKKYFTIATVLVVLILVGGCGLFSVATEYAGRSTVTELGNVEFEGRLYYLLASEKEQPPLIYSQELLHLYECDLDGTKCYGRHLRYPGEDASISVNVDTGILEVRRFDDLVYALSPEQTSLPTHYSNLDVITEDNTTSLRELVRIYSGAMFDLAWSSDSKVLAGSNEGLWLFTIGDNDVSMFHDQSLRAVQLDFVSEGQSSHEFADYLSEFVPISPIEGTDDTLIAYSNYAVVHPDSGQIALVEGESMTPIRVIDARSQTDFLITFTERFRPTGDMVFSSDGKLLYFTGGYDIRDDNYLYAWDTMQHQRVFTVSLPNNHNRLTSFNALSISPDDRIIATANTEEIVQFWATETGELITEFEVIETERPRLNSVRAIAFSPDGRLLATSGEDNTVRLWGVVDE